MAETPAFRIAMRTVTDGAGTWWVALLARMDTEDNALELGRIRRGAVEKKEIRTAFMEVMRETVAITLQELGVDVVEWKTQKPGQGG